jgi:hypothetical protein
MKQVTAARIAQEAYGRLGIRADAALMNERLTRERVERLEAVVNGDFRARLLWLLTGRRAIDAKGRIGDSVEQAK